MSVQDHTAPGHVVEYALFLVGGEHVAFGPVCSCGWYELYRCADHDEDADHEECE